jgi:glucokinase
MNNVDLAIGLDIGKTKIAAGIVSKIGGIQKKIVTETNIEEGGQAIIKKCLELISSLIEDSEYTASSIGVGASGVIDPDNGIIVSSGSIPDYSDIPIKKIFETEFKIPTYIDNDVYAAALGEHLFGGAKEYKTAIFTVISTGVGIAIIADKKIWHGSHCLSGQIAHLPLFDFGKTVNDYFSGKGISDAGQPLLKIPATTSEIFKLANEDNVDAKRIINDAIDAAALTFSWVQQIVDPDIFIFGGSVSIEQQEFIKSIIKRMAICLSKYIKKLPNGINYTISSLDKDAGLIGAAALAFSKVQ